MYYNLKSVSKLEWFKSSSPDYEFERLPILWIMSMKNNALLEVYSEGSNSDLSRTVAICISLQRKIVNFFKEAMHTV